MTVATVTPLNRHATDIRGWMRNTQGGKGTGGDKDK